MERHSGPDCAQRKGDITTEEGFEIEVHNDEIIITFDYEEQKEKEKENL